MPGRFASWNPLQNYVEGGMVDGQFASGGLTLLAAGPPRLAQVGGPSDAASNEQDVVYPIGCMQNFNLTQNKGFMRIWELGSDRSYHIGSRVVGQLGLSRVYYHGLSLLRIIYAYYQDLAGQVQVPWAFENIGAYNMYNRHDVIVPPGYENLFLNLASDMFNQPIGMMAYVRDSNLDTIGTCYFEACVVPNHSWATDAQGTIIQESASLQYERIVPVNTQSVALTSGLAASVDITASLSVFAGG